MKNAMLMKGAALFVLILLLMMPLAMVRATIAERASYQLQAREDISRSWGGAQLVVGPVLLQRYEVEVASREWGENLDTYVTKSEWQPRQRYVFPESLRITGDVAVERRYRGIHAIPVYGSTLDMVATVELPAAPEGARKLENVLLVAVSDTRGFRRRPAIQWEGAPLTVEPGTTTSNNGIQAMIDGAVPGTYQVRVAIALGGSHRLEIAPIGGDTHLALGGSWPHPQFTGGYLPESRSVSESGFHAEWRTSRYATTARDAVESCLRDGNCAGGGAQWIALELDDPVSVYLLNERSVKYGLLFVLIVFGVFLVFEVLKRLRIHPVQYGLVGLGQALFFLLLLSLSEHVAFGVAYVVGASACILLIACYVVHVLGGWVRGTAFAALLAAIYAALYVILISEDYALLLGSTLLFGLLAVTMYLTRHIDWYAITGRCDAPQPAGSTEG